jgi:protein involved in polysaccharide export with SLBB domain
MLGGMPTLARHLRPGRGLLFYILIAVAVFWSGISIGIVLGRRYRMAATQPAGPQAPATAAIAPATAPTVPLGPGDRVRLRLAGATEPRLAETTLTVDSHGNVAVPVIGTIRAQYLTPAQLEQAIKENYKSRNLKPPGTIEVVPAPATAPSAP